MFLDPRSTLFSDVMFKKEQKAGRTIDSANTRLSLLQLQCHPNEILKTIDNNSLRILLYWKAES